MTRTAQLVLDMLTGRERPATAYDFYGERRRFFVGTIVVAVGLETAQYRRLVLSRERDTDFGTRSVTLLRSPSRTPAPDR